MYQSANMSTIKFNSKFSLNRTGNSLLMDILEIDIP